MSGNPFRRGRGDRIPDNDRLAWDDGGDVLRSSDSAPTKKKKKSVKIQTPPHSPEEPPRRPSAGRLSPPPPPRTPEDDEEGSDTTTTADSDLEQALRNTRRNSGSLAPPALGGVFGPRDGMTRTNGAPYNPFARTLATSEAAFGLQRATEGSQDVNGLDTEAEGRKRPPMNVDQFKNILMTGSAIPSPAATLSSNNTQQSRFLDSSSNTDTSSTSHQSLFDPYFEMSQETPRSSFDQMYSPTESSEEEDGEHSGLMSCPTRLDDFAPPAPPKQMVIRPTPPRGPQTVSFSNFDEEITNVDRTRAPPIDTAGYMRPPPTLHRSPSDLNKPLPPPPAEAYPPAAPESEATIDPVSPTHELSNTGSDQGGSKKAPPPPPPASRRVAQSNTTTGRARSASNTTQSSLHDDGTSINVAANANTRSTAPPPPPTRKSRPTSQTAMSATEMPTTSVTLQVTPSPTPADQARNVPPPPPRRMASKAGNSIARTPSNASRSSAQRREESSLPSTGLAPAPPAPPPRRGAGGKRESIERTMSEDSGHMASKDILADLTAFQAEIDALRAKAGGQPG